jgi:3-phenylpropionate/trans-cinnamate dioxygenase ferredoxin reductase component
MRTDVLIIGAGHSGAMVAISLRQRGFKGSIMLLGKENYLPYQRPGLSKGFLSGQLSLERLFLRPDSFYKKNQINIITGMEAIEIDKNQKSVTLKNGKKISYNFLVFATGSIVNKIREVGDTEDSLYLRDIKDAISIKKALNASNNIVIIGGGYIGLEIASVASQMNIEVTIIEMENRILSRVVCDDISIFLQNKHEKEGVRFLLNKSVSQIKTNENKKYLTLDDQSIITTDNIIIGVGVKPNTYLAEQLGLDCQNGILVDEYGQTSIENIYATGDCANHYNAIYKQRLRLESVHNAMEQAKTIANSILGNNKQYNQVPWFWSDQYNIKLQIAGISSNYDNYLLRGSTEDEKFSVFYLKNNKIISIDSINDSKTFINGKKIIEKNITVNVDLLQDLEINLKSLIQDLH